MGRERPVGIPWLLLPYPVSPPAPGSAPHVISPFAAMVRDADARQGRVEPGGAGLPVAV